MHLPACRADTGLVKTGVSTTTYLYGINPIGEFGTQSVYYLADGAGCACRKDMGGFQASTRDAVNTNPTSGLVLHLAAYCYDMRRAGRAERILHALGDAGIVAEQDAGEERGLRLRQDLRDDVLGARLEGI